MKSFILICIIGVFALATHLASASQADDTTITITSQAPGVTPFINQLSLVASDTTALRSIRFTIIPKPGSVTRPLSGTYSSDYLTSRGYLQSDTGQIFLPVYGLYASYANTVTLTYNFLDGSSKGDSTTISTPTYDDPCQYGSPTVLQPRTTSTALSYDFILIRERCDDASPTIIDTDGAVRWVGPANVSDLTSTFYDSAVYQAIGRTLNRIDLDGTVTLLHDYADIGVIYLHHNIDRGKVGLILDASTSAYDESTNVEVDAAGNVLKVWSLGDIISAAMIAGGDDPTQFVYPSPTDWFHNNSVAYNRADDSIIVSSRENFVICLDYETDAIKWILGDPTKKWYQFPSLQQYALTLPEGTNPPIGQHAVSISYDQNLLLFDNGFQSWLQVPLGEGRTYSSPRKYELDLASNLATEIWNYDRNETIRSAVCSSVYEDAPFNYLVDYGFVTETLSPPQYGQILGLDAGGNQVFYYQYGIPGCNTAYNSIPLHLESTKFPAVGPQSLNLSTRGLVSSGDNVLIGGFVISGTDPKTVVLRALGPSLSDLGVTDVLADPVLSLYDSSGALVATNDNWQSNPNHSVVESNGLAPGNLLESAIAPTLSPDAYTVIVSGKKAGTGIGLVELYDLSPMSDSQLANISTRGAVGTGDDVLVSGFIVGDVGSATVVVRALGPSLASGGVSGVLERSYPDDLRH